MGHKFRSVAFSSPDELGEKLMAVVKSNPEHVDWDIEEPGSEKQFLMFEGRDFFITLSPISGVLEGKFVASLIPRKPPETPAKGWPRYYFDMDRAKAEVEAWIIFNGQLNKNNADYHEDRDNDGQPSLGQGST